MDSVRLTFRAIWLVSLACYVGFTLWVYADSKHRAHAERPVVISFGRFTIRTPNQWLVGCIFAGVIIIPVYTTNRNR